VKFPHHIHDIKLQKLKALHIEGAYMVAYFTSMMRGIKTALPPRVNIVCNGVKLGAKTKFIESVTTGRRIPKSKIESAHAQANALYHLDSLIGSGIDLKMIKKQINGKDLAVFQAQNLSKVAVLSKLLVLSKTNFIRGLQCLKLLWYVYNRKGDIPAPGPDAMARLKAGIEIGKLAQKLFPGGIELERDIDPLKMDKKSFEALQKGVPLFEAGFTKEQLYSLADILNVDDLGLFSALVPVEGAEHTRILIEFKSSASVKDVHIADVAFQKYVNEKRGIRIRKCFLMHINTKFVYNGEILFDRAGEDRLFIQEDVTADVDKLIAGSIVRSKIPKEIRNNPTLLGKFFKNPDSDDLIPKGKFNELERIAKKEIQDISLREIFIDVLSEGRSIKEKADEMLKVVVGMEPDVKIGQQCKKPYECTLIEHCWGLQPPDSVLNLFYNPKKDAPDNFKDFYHKGIVRMRDIPTKGYGLSDSQLAQIINPMTVKRYIDRQDVELFLSKLRSTQGYKLSWQQAAQIISHMTGLPYIDKSVLKEFIGLVKYPMVCWDCETISPDIPIYLLSHPYEDIMFQVGWGILQDKDAMPDIDGYLAEGKIDSRLIDPRPPILERIQPLLSGPGSNLAYHAQYEMGRTGDMVRIARPEDMVRVLQWFKGVKERSVDLRAPFKPNGKYFSVYYPAQEGSSSQKYTLAAITGFNPYKKSAIPEGLTARREYTRVELGENVEAKDRQRVREELKTYCFRYDVGGMVAIWWGLLRDADMISPQEFQRRLKFLFGDQIEDKEVSGS
jgi:hypothetical protein